MRLRDLFRSRAARPPQWLLPEAPTTWRQIRDGVGPVRRLGVPVLGAVALAAAMAAGAWWLPKATDPQRIARQAPDALRVLQPWLAGQTLEVPDGPGVWAWRQAGVDLVAIRARPHGLARTIGLCERRTGAAHDPDRIYPLTVVADLRAWAGDRRIARTPLVVPPNLADGMPMVTVAGRAPDRVEDMALSLQAVPTAGTEPGQWQVAMVGAGDDSAQEALSLQREAWVLWSPRSARHGTAGDGPVRHSRALRVRWQSMEGCAAGALQWQLFDADSATPEMVRGPATVWARQVGSRWAEGPPLRLSVVAGRHPVAAAGAVPMEDKALFDAAVQAGLIQPTPDGRLAVAPGDLFRLSGITATATPKDAGLAVPAAPDAPALPHVSDARRAMLLKQLYGSANGQFVRTQVDAANGARHWLALSVHRDDELHLAPQAEWQAQAHGEALALQPDGLPDVHARMFASWPRGWGGWLRVRAPLAWVRPLAGAPTPPEAMASVLTTALTIPLRSSGGNAGGQHLRMLLLGELVAVTNGTVQSNEPACDGPGCPAKDLLRRLVIVPAPGARSVTLQLKPDERFNALRPARAEQMLVQWEIDRDGRSRPVWNSPQGSGRRPGAPAEVSVVAQDGLPLFEDGRPTEQALALGLLPILGLDPSHGTGVSAMLARLGNQHDMPAAEARLTLSPQHQRLLHQILRCMGGEGRDWVVETETCTARKGGSEFIDPRREAHAVILDAHVGDILAVANGTRGPDVLDAQDQSTWAALQAFDRFQPAVSPLKPGAWVHYGGVAQSPGSTFKMLQALAVEQRGLSSPDVRAAAEGLSPQALDAQARQVDLPFQAGGACYPAPCPGGGGAGRPYMANFGDPAAPASRYAQQGRLGLVQALRNSINTWFAFTGEWIDATAMRGQADAVGLGEGALAQERPAEGVMDLLGWHRRWTLDGGLLPPDYDWQPQDVLQTSPSLSDAFVDRHSVRQQAIGLRQQTSPLPMASVAAAVATGRVVHPRLLQQLNDRVAVPRVGAALPMPLERVRAGLSAVVSEGTAAAAFASPELKMVRPYVFGKTGSAPLGNRLEGAVCRDLPMASQAPVACQHAAWFVGYLQPGTLPGENRTLAFAVQITHTRQLGGGLAAPVMARWIEAMRREAARSAASGTQVP